MNRQRKEGRFAIFQPHNRTRAAASNASNILTVKAMQRAAAEVTTAVTDVTDAFLAMKEMHGEDLTWLVKLPFSVLPLASFFPSLASSITLSEGL